MPRLAVINERLVRLSRQTGVPLVATNDSHYVRPEQHGVHDLFLAVQTGSRLSDTGRLQFMDPSYHLRTPAEMAALFPDLPAALDQAVRIGQQCHVELDFGQKRLPDFPTPQGQPADAYLTELAEAGLARRGLSQRPEYRERLDYELKVIRQTRFADYFLIVWDIVQFAHRSGIMMGVRGSAAASLTLYCLDITVADPIAHRLVFERFLNLERKEMPDIDMDFQDDRREEALNYVIQRYGSDRVAQLITFTRYGAKSALRAAAKAHGTPYAVTDRIARLLPSRVDDIAQAVTDTPELAELRRQDSAARELLDSAAGLKGIVCQTGSHAAGIVIAAAPVTTIAPLQPPTDRSGSLSVTQYGMDDIARIGLLKMDFLGLTSLTILSQALRDLPEVPDRPQDIPLDDPATYRLLSSGMTANVFQLESEGMQKYTAELQPSRLGDIAAMTALYRPGPMANIERFIAGKHERIAIAYPHPSLQETLDETYGVIVYQDQVLQIMRDFAGYSLGQADIVRKAMGKKIPELMAQERSRFITCAIAQGYPRGTAEKIFDLIQPFAGYAFNKAHSVSYALISYWTAWLKANYPTRYMATVLNCRREQSRNIYRAALAECQRLNLELRLPCVNASAILSAPEGDNCVRLGLGMINGVSAAAIAPIVAERERNGPYRSLYDFCRRSGRQGLTGKQLQLMAQAGALDTVTERGHAVANAERMWEYISQANAQRESGQFSIFDAVATPEPEPEWLTPAADQTPATAAQQGLWETETLGFPITANPIAARAAAQGLIASVAALSAGTVGRNLRLAGIVAETRRRTTRNGDPYVILTLDLNDGQLEVMLWQDTLNQTAPELCAAGAVVVVTGRLSERGEQLSLSATQITALSESGSSGSGSPEADALHFTITATHDAPQDELRLRQALRVIMDYPGDQPTLLTISDGSQQATLTFPGLTVAAAEPGLLTRLRSIPQLTVRE